MRWYTKTRQLAKHEEWLADWKDARSNEFFVLGSRDETGGCQLCVASISDDGSLTVVKKVDPGNNHHHPSLKT